MIRAQLKKIRERQKITQLKLSEISGVSYNTIIKIERGDIKFPSEKIVLQLARALNVDGTLLSDKSDYPLALEGREYSFAKKDPSEFEEIVYRILDRIYPSPEYMTTNWGGPNDGGKDIRVVDEKNRKVSYQQCKRYVKSKLTFRDFEKEILKIKKDYQSTYEDSYPNIEVVFWTVAEVSNEIRKRIIKLAQKEIGKNVDVDFAGSEKISRYLDKYSDIAESHWQVFGFKKTSEEHEKLFAKLESRFEEQKALLIEGNKTLDLLVQQNQSADTVEEEIKKSSLLIQQGKIEEAIDFLTECKGRYKQNDMVMAKIKNNLGVCHMTRGGFVEAMRFFDEAILLSPGFVKPKVNKSSLLIHSGEKTKLNEGFQILKTLWEIRHDIDQTEWALVARNYLKSVAYKKGPAEALKLLNDTELKQSLSADLEAKNFIINIYIGLQDFSKAEAMADDLLKKNRNAYTLMLKAFNYINKAQAEDIAPGKSLTPHFESLVNISKAQRILNEALKMADPLRDKDLLAQGYTYQLLIHMWKGEYSKIEKTIDKIDEKMLTNEAKRIKKLAKVNFYVSKDKNPAEAVKELKADGLWSKIPPYERLMTIIDLFLSNGFVEVARDLIEVDVIGETEDLTLLAYAYSVLSTINALLIERNLSISNAKKAIEIAEKSSNKEWITTTLKNYAGISVRDSNNEGDRLVDVMMKLQELHPKEKILERIKAVDKKGGLTKEIKERLKKSQEIYEKTRNVYLDQPIPTYLLSRYLKKTYPRFLNDMNDPYYVIHSKVGEDIRMKVGFEGVKSEVFVFDYLSLLDFSKAHLLGYLKGTGIKIVIPKSLFITIQEDLVEYENTDLRNLWNFLRYESVIEIIDTENIKKHFSPSKKLFDKWIIDEISLAHKYKGILVTNDARFAGFLNSLKINSNTIAPFIAEFDKQALLDKGAYTDVLVHLVDRHYTFFPFDSDLLYYIASRDGFKITGKSYFLVSQIRSNGANLTSFLVQFNIFLNRIFQSGINIEEKLAWVDTLLGKYFEALDLRGEEILTSDPEDFQGSLKAFFETWITVAKNIKSGEIRYVQRYLDSLKDHKYYAKSKIHIEDILSKVEKLKKSRI